MSVAGEAVVEGRKGEAIESRESWRSLSSWAAEREGRLVVSEPVSGGQ